MEGSRPLTTEKGGGFDMELFTMDEVAVEGMWKLAVCSILLVIVLILSMYKRINIEKELVLAFVRGFCQLMLLAFILSYLFESDDLLIVLVVLLIMVLFGGYTSAKRAKGIPDALSLTTFSIMIGSGIALGVMILSGWALLDPRFVIPLGGMAIGNSMNQCSLALNRLVGELKNNRNRIEASLALGATSDQALSPYSVTSIYASLIPTIDNLKTLGIILIPGMMTGLLMAGADPIWAAEFQLAIFMMILGAGAISTVLATTLARNRLFSAAHQLRSL